MGRLYYGVGGFCPLQNQEFASGKGQIESHWLKQHTMIPSQTQLVGQGFVHMQDNDPKHMSKLCQWFIKSKEEQHILQLMNSLVQSANLNPIELVWDELD